MRIKKIELCNFGSYEGVNSFDVGAESPEQRIVIVGGKNGAGKTTLFTAIQICLYGHIAFGYKSAGKLYYKELFSLINDKARMDENDIAYVKIVFTENRIDHDEFVMTRQWHWNNTNIVENLSVVKNNIVFNEDAIIDFQNYLLHLIPPDLLNLYFFDGEKIAEFFLGEQRSNLKEALLTLSGNDTYEILYGSIRRLLNGVESGNDSVAQNYADQKEALSEYLIKQQALMARLADLDSEIDAKELSIKTENEAYAASGGVSLDEWKSLQEKIKAEEELRERLNLERKAAANDVLPFLIVYEQLQQVYCQINNEKELKKQCLIEEAVRSKGFFEFLTDLLCRDVGLDKNEKTNDLVTSIQGYFEVSGATDGKMLFDLSGDEEASLLSVIARINNYNREIFKDYQSRIEQSIERGKHLREALKNSSIENFESHILAVSQMTVDLQRIQDQRERISSELQSISDQIGAVNKALESTRRSLELELKQQSVSALSDRTLLLVEELQEQQYRKLIASVESDLNKKFEQLIRKSDFVSHIYLDLDFTLHLMRNQSVVVQNLKETSRKHGTKALKNTLKERAYNELIVKLNTTEELLAFALAECNEETIELPVEVDYTRFSNGEKQILVMSLYWAIMNQSNNELPFIIDTPFARIDTEHRANITELFFKELKGQLFVLSTNEELRHEHLAALDEQIASVYLLEYGSDKRTHITQGNYFEV